MKPVLITTALLVASIMYSCNNHSEDEASLTQDTTQQASTKEDEHHHEEHEPITLNNGAKWKVDENMMTYIRKMETQTGQLAGKKEISLPELQSFADSLQVNLDALTTSCTMTGQAHDELHKWLVPFIDMASHLQKATAQEEARKSFDEIEESFHTFNTYFE